MDFFGTILMGCIVLFMFFALMALIGTIGIVPIIGYGLIVGGVCFGVYGLLFW